MSRLAILSTAVILAASPTLSAADDNPKEIITRAIKAHGGSDFLTINLAARSTNKGKIQIMGMEVEFNQEVAYMLPDKLKDSMELTIGGNTVKVQTLVNGDAISITANGNDVPVNDDVKKAIKDAMVMLKTARLVTLPTDKGVELSVFGEEKVEGKPAVGVVVAGKDRKSITMFFDKETGLLAKFVHRTLESGTGNEVNEERIVKEYAKNHDGIPLPKKILIKHDGKTFLEAEIVEMTFLESIDASEFKK
jgi:hypothetical protein